MAFAYCLDCAKRIYLGKRPWVGQAVFFDRCGADLEITGLHPLELDWTEYLVNEERDPLREPELVPAWSLSWTPSGSVESQQSPLLC